MKTVIANMTKIEHLKEEIEEAIEFYRPQVEYDTGYCPEIDIRLYAYHIAILVAESMVGEEREPIEANIKKTRYRGYSQGRNERIAEEKQLLEEIKALK